MEIAAALTGVLDRIGAAVDAASLANGMTSANPLARMISNAISFEADLLTEGRAAFLTRS